jgi:peptidoglycan hydrolase-like protein with peptidoglycan-binding domain
MQYELSWLPDTLMGAGLKVATVDGWRSRGRASMGEVRGVICHHTAGPLAGNMPSLRLLVEGRSDLRGPLAQLGLGRDGTYYVVAAGRCNHAGAGAWQGITTGNSNFIGIEAENMGGGREPWPEVQMEAYARGVAAILARIGQDVRFCAGHKEYALPAGRKDDPDFDMTVFRQTVSELMSGVRAPRASIPASELPAARETPRPTLRRNATGELVKRIQMQLGLGTDGLFGPATEAAVRGFQRNHPPLVPDGIVGPASWAVLDPAH